MLAKSSRQKSDYLQCCSEECGNIEVYTEVDSAVPLCCRPTDPSTLRFEVDHQLQEHGRNIRTHHPVACCGLQKGSLVGVTPLKNLRPAHSLPCRLYDATDG